MVISSRLGQDLLRCFANSRGAHRPLTLQRLIDCARRAEKKKKKKMLIDCGQKVLIFNGQGTEKIDFGAPGTENIDF